MHRRYVLTALFSVILGASPVRSLNNDDFAAMMGMLWRLREPICPRMTFDPETFVKALRLPGGSAEAVRRRRPYAFKRGYALAGEWLANGTPQFCAVVEQLFDGRHDIFGNVKDVPEPPPPGLTIR